MTWNHVLGGLTHLIISVVPSPTAMGCSSSCTHTGQYHTTSQAVGGGGERGRCVRVEHTCVQAIHLSGHNWVPGYMCFHSNTNTLILP